MTKTAVDRDLVLIQQDGLLLETVSRRRDLSAFSDEPIAALLAGLASDADRGGMAPAERYGPTGMRPPTHRIAPQPSRLSRHSGAVVLTVAALVVGSSGVAAAVTGDPFAPIKGVTHLVTGGADAGEGHVVAGPGGRKKGSLPETAAHVAVFTKKLTGVRPMLAKGDADAARDMLQSALADLVASGAPIPPGLQNRIDKLADRIDAVAATGDEGSGGGSDEGSGSGSDQGSGSGSDQGSGSGSDQGSGGGSDQGSGSGSDQGSGGGSGSGSDQGSGGGSGSGSDQGSGGGSGSGSDQGSGGGSGSGSDQGSGGGSGSGSGQRSASGSGSGSDQGSGSSSDQGSQQ